MRDVAARAGVSIATVSRVLNEPAKVAPETRLRVETAIGDLKFVPSAVARAMNRGRTGMVAALLPTLDNAIYARAVNGLEERLAEAQLSLFVAQTGDDPDTELARARQMVDVGAEAMIVVGIHHDKRFFDLVDQAQIPVVATSYYADDSPLPTIGYDNWEAATLAARHLADLGHRRVAVLHGPTAINDRMRRRREALQTQRFGLEFQYHEVSTTVEGGCRGVSQALDSSFDPTAILCFSDVIAHGALNCLHALDRRVPRDVSVIGMEDLPSSSFTYPALTSVSLSVEEIGTCAADAIIGWLKDGHRPASVKLPAELVVRETTGRGR